MTAYTKADIPALINAFKKAHERIANKGETYICHALVHNKGVPVDIADIACGMIRTMLGGQFTLNGYVRDYEIATNSVSDSDYTTRDLLDGDSKYQVKMRQLRLRWLEQIIADLKEYATK